MVTGQNGTGQNGTYKIVAIFIDYNSTELNLYPLDLVGSPFMYCLAKCHP